VKNDVEGMLKKVVLAQFGLLTHTFIKIALKYTSFEGTCYYCYLLNL